MPLFADTTALRRFAAIGQIELLREYGAEIVIGPEILMELGRLRGQVETEIEHGWIRVETPSMSQVAQLRRGAPELDQGEAELLALFVTLGTQDSRLLIDEGNAYQFVSRALKNRRHQMRCIAQVLQELEESGVIESAAAVFQRMIDEADYRWSNSVWRDYKRLCEDEGRDPLPNPRV
jgi:predicted nucleic acid-binding protein